MKNVDIIIIPFHDWRKSEHEGFRTRDVHFIQALSKSEHVGNILVVNRPLTWLELLYKKHKLKLEGKEIINTKKFSLTKVQDNIYVADYKSSDVIGQFFKKYLWFIKKYSDPKYADFISHCSEKTELKSPYLINQNIFAHKLAVNIKAQNKLFDAWDNFLKFPLYQNFVSELESGYKDLAENIPNWITNSNENVAFYTQRFDVKKIQLIKNGVKSNFASGEFILPKDIENIPRPVIGFGGKLSYLIDWELVNYITLKNPKASFVFVGQILDQKVYNQIVKRENVYFLGDKKYDSYPNYVKSFDTCIVPYNIKEGQHGGDSMKAYEYLLLNKKVVGTNGNGLEDLEEYVYIAKTKEDFAQEVGSMNNSKKKLLVKDYSWETKAKQILGILGVNE